MTARGAPIVLRLSLIYALLDNAKQIGIPHLKAALALWDYSVQSVKALFGDAVGDKEADKLLEALRSCKDGLTRDEIRTDVFANHISSERLDAVLDLLVRLKRIRSTLVKTAP